MTIVNGHFSRRLAGEQEVKKATPGHQQETAKFSTPTEEKVEASDEDVNAGKNYIEGLQAKFGIKTEEIKEVEN